MQDERFVQPALSAAGGCGVTNNITREGKAPAAGTFGAAVGKLFR
jgi:hypothetical protein